MFSSKKNVECYLLIHLLFTESFCPTFAPRSQTLASWAAYNAPVPMSAQSMVDLGTGQYLSTYTVQRAGNYSLNVFMPSQGGLRGSYYSCDYFAGSSLYSWRVDTVVDFNWGYALRC